MRNGRTQTPVPPEVAGPLVFLERQRTLVIWSLINENKRKFLDLLSYSEGLGLQSQFR